MESEVTPLQKGTCPGCGFWRYLQRDHVTPVGLGGEDHPDNTQRLCYDCHYDKSREDIRACRTTPAELARQSTLSKALWADPAFREKNLRRQSEALADPALRERRRQAALAREKAK